ncbi:hypothetical protein NL676_016797 [Syzygium grande]|nr:hypothetical protein NL676_016797 [Syzygium grande]
MQYEKVKKPPGAAVIAVEELTKGMVDSYQSDTSTSLPMIHPCTSRGHGHARPNVRSHAQTYGPAAKAARDSTEGPCTLAWQGSALGFGWWVPEISCSGSGKVGAESWLRSVAEAQVEEAEGSLRLPNTVKAVARNRERLANDDGGSVKYGTVPRKSGKRSLKGLVGTADSPPQPMWWGSVATVLPI